MAACQNYGTFGILLHALEELPFRCWELGVRGLEFVVEDLGFKDCRVEVSALRCRVGLQFGVQGFEGFGMGALTEYPCP